MMQVTSVSQTGPARPRTWISLLLVAALTLTVAVVGLVVARSFYDPQWNLTIAHLVEGDAPQPGVSDPVDVTASTCAEFDCVEAYDTAEALYVRFASRDGAARYAAEAADTFRSNYIVMDFSRKPDVAPERQRLAMEYLVGTWQDFEGTLPTRR